MLSLPIGYELTSKWFEYAREHPGRVNTNHTALYSWLVEVNKGNGWAAAFGCSSAQAMQGMGVKRYETFKKTFDDLVAFGFVELVSTNTNQYSEKKIALLKNSKALRRPIGVQLELPLRVVLKRKTPNPKAALSHLPQDLFSESFKTVCI